MPLESQWREPSPGGTSLATVAVDLLSRGRATDLSSWRMEPGGRWALHLAGIYSLDQKQLNIVDPGYGRWRMKRAAANRQ